MPLTHNPCTIGGFMSTNCTLLFQGLLELLMSSGPRQQKFVDVRILNFVKKHNKSPCNEATQSACRRLPDATRKGGVASMQFEI